MRTTARALPPAESGVKIRPAAPETGEVDDVAEFRALADQPGRGPRAAAATCVEIKFRRPTQFSP